MGAVAAEVLWADSGASACEPWHWDESKGHKIAAFAVMLAADNCGAFAGA